MWTPLLGSRKDFLTGYIYARFLCSMKTDLFWYIVFDQTKLNIFIGNVHYEDLFIIILKQKHTTHWIFWSWCCTVDQRG